MKKMTTGAAAVLLALVPATLLAHHSLALFDTTKPVRAKGVVVRIHELNPHSFIYLEEKLANGQIQRWAAEGPGLLALRRQARFTDLVKVGDEIEICGYLPKEPTVWQVQSQDGTPSLAGRLINGEMLKTADGREQSWGDYGVHLCFSPSYTDMHSRR